MNAHSTPSHSGHQDPHLLHEAHEAVEQATEHLVEPAKIGSEAFAKLLEAQKITESNEQLHKIFENAEQQSAVFTDLAIGLGLLGFVLQAVRSTDHLDEHAKHRSRADLTLRMVAQGFEMVSKGLTLGLKVLPSPVSVALTVGELSTNVFRSLYKIFHLSYEIRQQRKMLKNLTRQFDEVTDNAKALLRQKEDLKERVSALTLTEQNLEKTIQKTSNPAEREALYEKKLAIGLKKQELVSEGKLIKQKLLELKHERDDSKQAIPQLKAKIIQLKTERKAVIQENRSNMAVLGTASALLLIGLIPTPASPVLLGAGALLLTAYSAVRLSMALIKGGNHLGKWLGSKLGLAAQKESSSQHANHSTVQTQSSLSTNLSAHSQIDLETPHDSIKNQASSENLTHHEETLLHDAPPSPTPMYPESTGVKDEALTHTDLLFTTDFIEHNIHPETTASLAETPQKKSRIDEDEGEGEGKSESTGFRLDL